MCNSIFKGSQLPKIWKSRFIVLSIYTLLVNSISMGLATQALIEKKKNKQTKENCNFYAGFTKIFINSKWH